MANAKTIARRGLLFEFRLGCLGCYSTLAAHFAKGSSSCQIRAAVTYTFSTIALSVPYWCFPGNGYFVMPAPCSQNLILAIFKHMPVVTSIESLDFN